MQEPRGEEELGAQGPRGPPVGGYTEEGSSSRGPQENYLKQKATHGCAPQLSAQVPQELNLCQEPNIASTDEQPTAITEAVEKTVSQELPETKTEDSGTPGPQEPSNRLMHPNPWALTHILPIGIQEHCPGPHSHESDADHIHYRSGQDALSSQEPSHDVGPQATGVHLDSLEPHVMLDFLDLVQKQPSIPELTLSDSVHPVANEILAPAAPCALCPPEIPVFYRPSPKESHVQLGPEELPDEEFPLLVDPISVLGLQGDLQEVPDFEDVVSETPSPEPEDMFGGIPAGHLLLPGVQRRGVNMTEAVPVPSSEHVAEIVGRQGCKIKALRAKTNTYIKTPVRGEEPIFIVTGRKEDVEMAKREILAAADHFSVIRASRNKNLILGSTQGPPNLPGQTTIQVRVPYRVVGLVVGPKGATIKRIQQSTHTYIVTPSRDKEPVFEVTGMPENVDRAREEIEAHITMRTGSLVDINPDNDFHRNGTDVCTDLLGGGPSSIWAKVPAPRRGSAASRSEIGSSSEITYFATASREQDPASPFRPILGGGFSLGEPHTVSPALGTDDCDFGFDFMALDLNTPTTIWSPFETPSGKHQNFSACNTQRRNSVVSGSTISPTLPEPNIGLEHPLARRIHSDPMSATPWLPMQGSLSSFSNSTGYSSSSSLLGSSSVASGSPTDSTSSDGQRKSARDCVICYESEVIAALVPCGHNLFCMECAIKICERVLPECPACHAPATQAIRIFS
ncbi:RNA-binding protein MEX3D [Spea bombifrons]|uniref:RNA-binding protein MEX3D n=1 Tax=Spea bombifrons TaxID=233779 RepID=UPI00234A3998|nr:RNA-binding protein MEX3D [Spea bombifrons]